MKYLIVFLVLSLFWVVPLQAQNPYSPLPWWPAQFSDSMGRPVANGAVCFTASGTTNNLTVYQTPNGTGHQNPVRLDASGLPPGQGIYLQPGLAYSVKLYAAGTGSTCNGQVVGALIKSADNVIIGAAASASTINDCSTSAGADAGAKIAACIAALPATGGVADARALQGAQTFTTDPFAGVTKPVTVNMPSGTVASSVNITVPTNITLDFGQGSIVNVGTATTFLVNGHVMGTLDKHFQGVGTLTLAQGSDYPEWFGAIADGTTDNAASIQAAINAFSAKMNPYGGSIGPAGGGWGTVRFGTGVYVFKSSVAISKSGVHLSGEGYSSTILRFQPISAAVALTWQAAASETIHDTGIENMTIDATGSSTSVVKTALKPVGISHGRFRDLVVRNFHDTTHNSKCVEYHGRDTTVWDTVELWCDQPLDIQTDPTSLNEGLDTTAFRNVLLVAFSDAGVCITDQPVVNITGANAQLTNVIFDHFDFICGSYSVYWTASTTKGGNNNVAFVHGRNEQGPVPNWAFYIAPAQPILGLQIQDVSIQSATKGGWYIRNVSNGFMSDTTYGATASIAAIDVDSTVHMGFRNNNWNVHTSGVYTAFNGWCGVRSDEDAAGVIASTGQMLLRSCGPPSLTFQTPPLGTTYNITAASCAGPLLTYTTSPNTFVADGQIKVAGVLPAGLNGTFAVISATGGSVTVVNDQCPLTYSSGGAAAMTYGPPSYLSSVVVTSDQAVGDLGIRTDGSKIAFGFNGNSALSLNTGWLQFYDALGMTPKAYIGNRIAILPNWTTDDLQIRSEGSAIRFGTGGRETASLPSAGGGILFDAVGSTPVGGTGTVGFGVTIQAAGTGDCPTTVTINGAPAAPAGCIVITVGGTGRSIPFF